MADGLKIDDLEVFADFDTNGLRFTVTRGGLQSLPTYVGEDDVVVGASGREAGEWIADTLEVTLHGQVAGSGASAQAKRESFKTRAETLLGKMDPTTLVDLTAYEPFFGLAEDEVATLSNCRPLGIEGPDPSTLWYEGWELSLRFVCIDSPPIWVVSDAS